MGGALHHDVLHRSGPVTGRPRRRGDLPVRGVNGDLRCAGAVVRVREGIDRSASRPEDHARDARAGSAGDRVVRVGGAVEVEHGDRVARRTRVDPETAGLEADRNDPIGQFARESVRHDGAVRVPCCERAVRINGELRADPVDDGTDESDVVDGIGGRGTAAVPAVPRLESRAVREVADPVGVHDDESIRLGECIEAGVERELRRGAETAMECDEQRHGSVGGERRGHVEPVVAVATVGGADGPLGDLSDGRARRLGSGIRQVGHRGWERAARRDEGEHGCDDGDECMATEGPSGHRRSARVWRSASSAAIVEVTWRSVARATDKSPSAQSPASAARPARCAVASARACRVGRPA